jgi:hypothetical protein
MWISVTKSMPTRCQQVITIDSNEEQAVCIYKGSNEWRYMGCYDDCCGCNAANITHWMKLPEPPVG